MTHLLAVYTRGTDTEFLAAKAEVDQEEPSPAAQVCFHSHLSTCLSPDSCCYYCHILQWANGILLLHKVTQKAAAHRIKSLQSDVAQEAFGSVKQKLT